MKLYFKIVAILSLMILFTSFSCAQKDEVSILLDNGIRIVYKNILHARVITLLMNVNSGSILETEQTRGIAQLTAQCLFHQSRHYTNIKRTIDSFGARFYAESSHQDFSTFSLSVGEPFVDSMATILADVIQYPVFNDSLITLTKKRLKIESLQDQNNMQGYLKKIFLRSAFHVHPYRFFYRADIDDILKLELDDIRKYHKNTFIPENISIIVAGPESGYRAVKQLQRLLKDFHQSPDASFSWEEEPEQLAPRKIRCTHPFDSRYAFVTVGWKAPSIRNTDTFTMDVILAVLGMGESSRLNKHIRDQYSGVYYVWAEYLTPRDPGVIMINAICDSASVETIEKAILKECAILRKDQITSFEIDRAVQVLEAQEAYQWESTESAAAYLGYWTVMKDYNFAKNYLKQIRSVSIEDVQAVAEKYLGKKTYTSLIMLPESEPVK